jgi:hypothetical protein
MDELKKDADRLAIQKFTDEDVKKALQIMFPIDAGESDRRKENVEKIKNDIRVCMFAPDLANFVNTKWGFVQAVADYTSHTDGARKTVTGEENRWASVMGGAQLLDKAYSVVNA